MSSAIATGIPNEPCPAVVVVKSTADPLIVAENGANPPTSPYAFPYVPESDSISLGAGLASAITLCCSVNALISSFAFVTLTTPPLLVKN